VIRGEELERDVKEGQSKGGRGSSRMIREGQREMGKRPSRGDRALSNS